LGVLFCLALVVAGCTGGSPIAIPTPSRPPSDLPELSRSAGIPIGTGVNDARMVNKNYQQRVLDNFTSITPANAFKWENTEPAQGQFDFGKPDPLVQFAVDHHLRVRGCCLTWRTQNPAWLESGTFTKAQATAIMRDHIRAVVGRYKGKVAQWEVVNEIFHTVNGQLAPFNSVWLKTIGPGYVADAFRTARAADPNALLFANEFGNDGPGPHFNAFYNKVRALKLAGVPIDGVGLQMHRGLQTPTVAQVEETIRKYAALGLRVEITEFDIPLPLPPDQQALEQQGVLFGQITSVCLRIAACTGITFWGVDDNDRYPAIRTSNRGAMTMFDEMGNPKPAYFAVVNALRAAPAIKRLSGGPPAG
jgi:endo-1,4-beta-xylanase